MLASLSMKIAKKLDVKQTNDNEVIAFAVEGILATLINLLLLLSLALWLDRFMQMLVFIIAFSIIRNGAGGSHADNHLLCFITYADFSLAAIYLAELLAKTWLIPYAAAVLMLASGILVFLFAPKDHPNRRFTEEEFVRFRKRSRTVIILLVPALILVYIFWSHLLALTGAMAIFVNSATLIKNRKKGVSP